MERKIIGYKLVKPEYKKAASMIAFGNPDWVSYEYLSVSSILELLNAAGVLDLWFEPIYEQPKFKVGDWVTIEDSRKLQSGCRGCPTGTYQVVSDEYNNGLFNYKDGFNVRTSNSIWKISSEGVRHATPEEIEAASFPFKVGDYITFEFPEGHEYDWANKNVVEITDIEKNKMHKFWINHTPESCMGGGFSYRAYKDNIRLSTFKEIEVVSDEYNNGLFNYKEKTHKERVERSEKQEAALFKAIVDHTWGLMNEEEKEVVGNLLDNIMKAAGIKLSK